MSSTDPQQTGDLAESLRARIAEYEQRFFAFSQACHEGMAIHERGRILEGNPTLCAMFGYERDKLIGMQLGELLALDPVGLGTAEAEAVTAAGALCRRRDGTTFHALSELVEEMAHLLQAVVSKRAVLKYEFAPELPAIEGDAAQIRQVVMNLITNASDALEDRSGVIAVGTGVIEADRTYLEETFPGDDLAEGQYAFVEVSDTGCGMDEGTRRQIFDPFFTTKFTGRGLGLAAVLGIVRGHQGAIRIYSELGRGTTVKVLLPTKASLSEVRPIAAADATDWRAEGLALVVDDDEIVREVAKAILEQAGFSVVVAADGVEAVELFQKRPDEFCFVLLDMTMPRMDGIKTFQALRRVRPAVKVVLSSGYNEQDATDRVRGKGLAGFAQKPYTPAELLQIVRGVLER